MSLTYHFILMAAALALLPLAGPALAQTANLNVTAQVDAMCEVFTGSLNFGTYTSAADKEGEGEFSYKCASGTNITQRYLDTYYVQSPARVAPQLGFVPTTWTDYLVTVFAFVKPDGDPLSPDGAMASGSIQVTFRDWVHHWIVDDFFLDFSDVVEEYRGVIPGLIHTDLRASVDGVMDEIERRVRGGGILGGQREFAAATDAIRTVRVQNAPDFFEDAIEAVSGGIAVQRAVSYGEAVTPRAGTSAQSARAAPFYVPAISANVTQRARM